MSPHSGAMNTTTVVANTMTDKTEDQMNGSQAISLFTSLAQLSLEDPSTCSETDESSQGSGHHFTDLKHIETPTKTRSRSILKEKGCLSTEYVCTKRSAYKALPVPDLKKLSLQEGNGMNSATSSITTKQHRRNNTVPAVSFNEIQIRLYDQTIGDHPNTSCGPPIALDWKFQECETIPLDAYEENRGARRDMRGMRINYYTRKNTLMWAYGISEEEIKRASRATSKAQFQRGVTKYFLPVSKIEEAVESVGRKAKRVVHRRTMSV